MSAASFRWFVLFFSGLGWVATAAAQTTGTIRGTARDTTGSPLPGVTVTVTSESRGTSRSTSTGASGSFVLPTLPVDSYSVETRLDGFLDRKVGGVRVGIGSTTELELVLPPASVEDTITVSSAPILDATSSSVDTSFSAEFLEDLATDRNFFDMIAVAPGISPESENSADFSAFGSSITSNSWSVDGQEATNHDTGNAWWYINPATIEEIQVLAVGAPAQYGNMSGAAFNVVTKSGTNDFKGSVDLYLQDDGLTDENAEVDGIPFRRDQFRNFSVTLGGPLRRDEIWFFGAYENARDASSAPGEDPDFPDTLPSDRYDLKVTAALEDSHLLEAKLHYEDYDWAFGDPFQTPDAQESQFGQNPAWAVQLQSVLSSDTYLEARYAGYNGTDNRLSRTRSTADPFIDVSPPDGGPQRFSGSLFFPYIWELSREQVDVNLSHHTDELLAGDHDFKFGITYGQGEGDTITAGGPNGVYYYRYEYSFEYYGNTYTYPYYYRVTGRPYHYGAEAESISAFVDDSWQVNDRLTLNLGVRLDQHKADIPSYPRLLQDWSESGDFIPGLDDAIDWTLVSPRLGFAWKTGERGVLRGFYGKFYDGNVTGNWYTPPPDAPSYLYEVSSSRDGPYTPFFLFEQDSTTVDPDLRAPETDQLTLGYEHQIGAHYTLGIQAIYKDSKNLIGWEILGDGELESVPWTNPFTGEVVQLASILVQPSTRKGNGPGPGSLAPPGARYEQEYKGAFVHFARRYADGWSLRASYTWSDSEGFLPRPLSQSQGAPFYTASEGRDPNHWINAQQALQNEREHVFQLQGTFELPWKLVGTAVYSFLDGKPFSRQVRVGAGSSSSPLAQGTQEVIALPAGSEQRLPSQSVLDLSLGRRFFVGSAELKLDVQLLNTFNEDAHDAWETLEVPPGSFFQPTDFLMPRRFVLRLGVGF